MTCSIMNCLYYENSYVWLCCAEFTMMFYNIYLLGSQIHLYLRTLKLYWDSSSHLIWVIIFQIMEILDQNPSKLSIWLVITQWLMSKVQSRFVFLLTDLQTLFLKLCFIMFCDWFRIEIPFDNQAGHPWFSILTRTGVFNGNDNHADFPADLVS